MGIRERFILVFSMSLPLFFLNNGRHRRSDSFEHQVRTSHAMLLIVNAWSASVLRRDFNCLRSKQEWKRGSLWMREDQVV